MKTQKKDNVHVSPITTAMVFVALTMTVLPGAARAAWEGDEKPEFGNAYTLSSGEWQVGLLRPTSVGLTDRLQLSTVLLGDVLGIPNVDLKLTLVDTEHVALSLSGFGLYAATDKAGGAGGNLTVTVPIGERFYLSASAGYSWLSGSRDNDQGSLAIPAYNGITMGGEAELLFNPHNILVFSATSAYDLEAKDFSPVTMGLFYAHAWDTFRLMVGVAYQSGGWDFDLGDDEKANMPVMPMVDFWWRW